jgi:hypothetical protein
MQVGQLADQHQATPFVSPDRTETIHDAVMGVRVASEDFFNTD